VNAKSAPKLSSLGNKRPAWLGMIDNAPKGKDPVVEPLAAEPQAPSNVMEFPAPNPPQSKVVPFAAPAKSTDEISLTFTEPAEPMVVDRRKYLTLGAAAFALVASLVFWTWHSHRTNNSQPPVPPAAPVQQQSVDNDPSFQTPPPVDQPQVPAAAPARAVPDKPSAQKSSAKSNDDRSSVTAEDTVTIVDSPIRKPAESRAQAAPEPEAPPSVTITSATLPADLLSVKTSLPKGPSPPTSHFVPSEVLQKVTPVYPEVARRYHQQGKVVLSVTVDATGKVKNVKVIDGAQTFVQSAVEAVKRWKYRPASLNGQSVESSAEITLNFASK
jgi:protein TonB